MKRISNCFKGGQLIVIVLSADDPPKITNILTNITFTALHFQLEQPSLLLIPRITLFVNIFNRYAITVHLIAITWIYK